MTTRDQQNLPESYIFPQNDEVQYDVELRRYLRQISNTVNRKESAYYLSEETYTGGSFIPLGNPSGGLTQRNIFRSVVDFGALPNASIKAVPHNLTFNANTFFLKIYGAATQITGGNFMLAIPLTNIAVNPTQVTITTTTDLSTYVGFVILEYIR